VTPAVTAAAPSAHQWMAAAPAPGRLGVALVSDIVFQIEPGRPLR
jgi:hypothetical protein